MGWNLKYFVDKNWENANYLSMCKIISYKKILAEYKRMSLITAVYKI
jgi:hypothetical protein